MPRRAFALALAAATLAAVAPAAGAHPDYDYEGGCDFAGTRAGGVMWFAVTATDTAGAPAPVALDVECVVYKNGAYHSTPLSGGGGGSASNARTWQPDDPNPSHQWDLCTFVTVGGEVHVDCAPIQFVGVSTGDPVGTVERTVCPLVGAVPDVPGVVETTPDGDVYVLGELFWDCPPYAT